MRKLTDTIKWGSCEDVLREYPDDYFSSVVTDPPYGLSFMGKKWDYDVPSVKLWKAVARVLKPGAHMLVCCGTRTQHAMVRNIELAGFEIRDIVVWIYGSGFPKSANIAKAIDKLEGVEFQATPATGVGFMNAEGRDGYNVTKNRLTRTGEQSEAAAEWEGWGTALKPSAELWTLCRKPLSEKSTARNVLAHGTGGINIDASRIGTEERTYGGAGYSQVFSEGEEAGIYDGSGRDVEFDVTGRWPANVVLGHHIDCKKVGTKKIKGHISGSDKADSQAVNWNMKKTKRLWTGPTDEHGNETVDDWDCHPECPVAIMDEQSGELTSGDIKEGTPYKDNNFVYGAPAGTVTRDYPGDSGGASRFFYQAKAHNAERYFYCKECQLFDNDREKHEAHRTELIMHPTQKPEELMRYLVRMITPPTGVVLDPFLGSGTSCVAAKLESLDCVGIERDKAYHAIARVRYRYAGQKPLQERPLSGLEI